MREPETKSGGGGGGGGGWWDQSRINVRGFNEGQGVACLNVVVTKVSEMTISSHC